MFCVINGKSDQKNCVKIDMPPQSAVIGQDGGISATTKDKTAISISAKVEKQHHQPCKGKASKILLVFLCFLALSGMLFIMQQHFLSKHLSTKFCRTMMIVIHFTILCMYYGLLL